MPEGNRSRPQQLNSRVSDERGHNLEKTVPLSGCVKVINYFRERNRLEDRAPQEISGWAPGMKCKVSAPKACGIVKSGKAADYAGLATHVYGHLDIWKQSTVPDRRCPRFRCDRKEMVGKVREGSSLFSLFRRFRSETKLPQAAPSHSNILYSIERAFNLS